MSENIKKTVAIKHVLDGVASQYSNHFAIQHTEHEFIIYFFDLQEPLFLGSPEQIKEQAEDLEFVEAHCISKIVISQGRMETFLNAIIENFEKHQENYGKEDTSS